ncbi:glycerophosphodiester phosphodiesterase family protein [Plantibacter sp. YIM 135347]|uniref:glycerophosphodiester phosphodiesterase family protein n=1 Tax=Plantibacter sp. YIM 135347 TaxID=3423919 RepID=UPI003D34FF9C
MRSVPTPGPSVHSLPHPIVIGHRGASGYRPEHTRSAYELAFALGADAVEPDLVASQDGVLVVRHENEISGTTDIADHPEFADRRTTKTIDGETLTGWFTEDFTWEELSTLTARERIADVRASSASFDGQDGLLRFVDLVEIVRTASVEQGRPLGIVAEIKHASHFASIGLPLDVLFAAELAAVEHGGPRSNDSSRADAPLIVESFEKTVLLQLAERGVAAQYIYLVERSGKPADLVAAQGEDAPTYAEALTDAGLAVLAEEVDGISVDKTMLLATSDDGAVVASADLVERAHAAGLVVYTWTLRPENRFLSPGNQVGEDAAAFGDWRAEFDAVLSTGVDGIFVDQPDLGVDARDAFRPGSVVDDRRTVVGP